MALYGLGLDGLIQVNPQTAESKLILPSQVEIEALTGLLPKYLLEYYNKLIKIISYTNP